MIVNLNLLRRLSDRFGVASLSKHPELEQLLFKTNAFIKAPVGFEPLITGGGYQWNNELNGYTLGDNQTISLLPDGKAIWVFKNVLFRLLTPNSIRKWVSGDEEYPMGKANAFLQIYGKLTGQELGQNETAGDEVPNGEQDADGGGIAAADDENALKFTKADIQKMLAGGWPDDSVSTGLSNEPSAPMTGPHPSRLKPNHPIPSSREKAGQPQETGSEADNIINTIHKKAKISPQSSAMIKLPADDIIDIYTRAKGLPEKEKEKVMKFLQTKVQPLQEGKISKATLNTLIEHIVNGILDEVEKAKTRKLEKEQSGAAAAGPTSGPMITKKKVTMEGDESDAVQAMWAGSDDEMSHHEKMYGGLKPVPKHKKTTSKTPPVPSKKHAKIFVKGKQINSDTLDEMTTTSGGGGSSAGTPGYNIPGAFAGGTLEKNKKHIEVLGYKLTPDGEAEMKKRGDNLYETYNPESKNCQNCGYLMSKDKIRCPKCQHLQDDSKPFPMGPLQENGLGPDYYRAQKAYDNQTDASGDGLECPECGHHAGDYIERGRGYYQAKCGDCGAEWGMDNFDARDDR